MADRAPAEKTLLLWGSVDDGELLLEPAFLAEGVPTLPESGGAYRLEGFGEGGRTHFSFDFTPDPVEFGGGQFLFAVPYDPGSHGALERIVLSGPEGEFALTPGSTSPMAIITNRASGQVPCDRAGLERQLHPRGRRHRDHGQRRPARLVPAALPSCLSPAGRPSPLSISRRTFFT